MVEVDDSSVRLDSAKATIRVCYDRRRSFELGVYFGELVNGQPKERVSFSLGEICREFAVPNAENMKCLASTDLAIVCEILVTVAGNLEEFCEEILGGDSAAFASVNERRSREALAYAQLEQIRSVRPKADAAWREKRYQDFVDLLSALGSDLQPSDQKKLVWAIKRLRSSVD